MAHQPPPPSAAMLPSTSISAASSHSNQGSPPDPPRTRGPWDGDRMLHIYMIDYCRKRGFTHVVGALCATTNNAADVPAPIDAPQGLLFEWWVVFWEIFTAKSNEVTSKDAATYLQAQRLKQERQFRGIPGQDPSRPAGGPAASTPGQTPMQGQSSTQGPPPMGPLMGPPPPHQSGPFPPSAPTPGAPPHMQPQHSQHPQPNGIPPSTPQQPQAPHPHQQQQPVPPPGQHANGPQPYPPQQTPTPVHQQPPQIMGQPHPNGPQQMPPGGHPGGPGMMGLNGRPGGPGQNPQQIPPQRGPAPGHGPNPLGGQPGQQNVFSGSPLGGPGGPSGPSPRIANAMGPPSEVPANRGPTPAGMVNGGGPPNHTPTMSHQQPQPTQGFPSQMGVGRPGSRSGTPGGAGAPQMGMSPSRMGQSGPMGSRPNQTPQMGGAQGPPQHPSQMGGSPFLNFTSVPQHLLDQAMSQVGFAGRNVHDLSPDDKNKVAMTVKRISGTPRMHSGPNPMMMGGQNASPAQGGMPPPQQPGGPQGGPGFGQQPFPQQGQQHQMMGQGQPMMAGGKRPGSPNMMDSPMDNSPQSQAKRQRRNSGSGAGPNPMTGYPGAPGQSQQQMPNGVGNHGPGNPIMRPGQQGLPGSQQHPGPGNPMMSINGNPSQMGGQMRQGQPQPPRYSQMMSGNKPQGLVANSNPSGLPIPVDNDRKMQGPSPSLPNAKPPGSMPPPSHTPNPSQSLKVKDEPLEAASTKSSPGSKPAPPPNAAGIKPPSTPIPGGGLPFPSTTAPSPSSILASTALNPSSDPSRAGPGSNAASNNNPAAFLNAVNGLSGDMYNNSFSALNMLSEYNFDGLGKEEQQPLSDADFDKYLWSDLMNVGLGDDAGTTANSGS